MSLEVWAWVLVFGDGGEDVGEVVRSSIGERTDVERILVEEL